MTLVSNQGRLLLALAAVLLTAVCRAGTLEQVLERGTLRVGVALFVPWAMKGQDGKLRGFEIDVANQLAADMGVKPQINLFEWDKLLPALEQDKIDIIAAGMGITPGRALRANFSVPYATSGISMATNLPRTKNIKKLEELNQAGTIVAVVAGTVSEKLANKLFDKTTIKAFVTSEEASQAVIKGDVHAYVESTPIPRFIALDHPNVVDVPVSKPLLIYKAAFAIHKGDADFVNFLNAWVVAREADTWLSTTHEYWFDSLQWREKTR